ncbi:MAG: hypothetical protein AAB670_01325 [Patescibacteria group bacterium]
MKLKRHHFGILILTLFFLAGGLLSYTLVKNGYFPVARVNGNFISYRTVKENMELSRRIYSRGLAGSSVELSDLFKRGNETELLKNSLENLITTQIIRSAVGPDTIKKVSEELEKNFDPAALANITALVRNVYNWDTAKFKERILEPQALLDVVTQEKGREFEPWLKLSKSQAKVSLWFVPFEWKDGKLEIRK